MTEQEESTPRFGGFGLKPAEPFVNPGGSVRTAFGIPQGLGPLIGKVQKVTDGGFEDDGKVAAAELNLSADPVFYLVDAASKGVPSLDSINAVSPVLPVAPLAQLGSATMAAALKECSLPDLLEALAFDVVLIPVTKEAGGELATRLFVTEEPGEPVNCLCVFSSAQTLESFLGDDPERHFVVRQGASVIEYLGRQLDAIDTLVFDPAGPSPVRVPAALFPKIVEIATVTGEELAQRISDAESEPLGQVTGFKLNLDANWGTIDLVDKSKRDQQIRRLVAKQTRNLGDKAATLRHEMRTWLTSATGQAANVGGHQLGFLLAGTANAAAALSVTSYFHDLGRRLRGGVHLDKIAEHLGEGGSSDQELVDIDMAGTRVLRHIRTRRGDPRIGGGDVNLLLIDYWMSAPDDKHVAHVAFSTPHLDAKDAMVMLADNVVITGYWVTDNDGIVPVDNESDDASSSVVGGV